MILPERRAMRDGEQGDPQPSRVLHHHAFHVWRDERRSLVQHGILHKVQWNQTSFEGQGTHLRLVVEQPRPGDLLLVTTAQRLAPLACGVPAALALDDVFHLHDSQDLEQIIVGDAPCVYTLMQSIHSPLNGQPCN